MPWSGINWVAVVLGAVFNMALGALWYGPLFGNLWLKWIGKSKEELESSPGMYLGPLAAAFVSALVLDLIVLAFGAGTWYQGLWAGVLVWVGIGATATLTTHFFEDQSTGVWLLFAAYQLVVFAVQGLVFAVW